MTEERLTEERLTEEELAEKILESIDREHGFSTGLDTNQRVIARVTDGIYREPGAAIRELVSNAYDADATRVVIRTDAPRFAQISVEDDGNGMPPEAVANLIKNIGGSAKRTGKGQALGITAADSATMSPGGRRLIGKLGIGIFSVSQLTRSFEIITKTSDDPFRTVVRVALHQFSDDVLPQSASAAYRAGDVDIWRERTSDIGQHGTTIRLTNIRPSIGRRLQSRDMWDVLDDPIDGEGAGDSRRVAPRFHIGRVDSEGRYRGSEQGDPTALPWERGAQPDDAFRAMVDRVWELTSKGHPNATLENLFDNYLRMVWKLGLALPVRYYDEHLFDIPVSADVADWYRLSNRTKGAATPLEPGPQGSRVRDLLDLTATDEPPTPFQVFVDDIEILRPIRYRGNPKSANALTRPLGFLGKYRETFEKLPHEFSAGPLAFEAYLFWTPRVVPVDHRGVLVRIHGASGSEFDATFFGYQVAELTRLRQITCEVFVEEGLEAALNIDREGYNTAHPHMVVLIRWVHSALRQLATTQKNLGQIARRERREQNRTEAVSKLDNVVRELAEERASGEEAVPEVVFTPSRGQPTNDVTRQAETSPSGAYVYDEDAIWSPVDRPGGTRKRQGVSKEVVIAIAKVLSIYGAFDHLAVAEQEDLLARIVQILEATND